MHNNSLKILYWNADGIGNKIKELLQLVSELSIDIIALSETKLPKHHTLVTPGYSCYRQDKNHNGHGQGVALLIKCIFVTYRNSFMISLLITLV